MSIENLSAAKAARQTPTSVVGTPFKNSSWVSLLSLYMVFFTNNLLLSELIINKNKRYPSPKTPSL